MSSPFLVAASPCGHLFDHQCFAHGRIFRRYHGSEACRFSPEGAFILLARLSRALEGRWTLWDPFCGTGLIPGIASAFFAHRFPRLIVSDVLPAAAPCALGNALLFRDDQALAQRLREIEILGRPSLRHRQRWSTVGAALARFVDTPRPRPECITAHVVPAQHAPRIGDERLVLLGDLPYGRASPLHGAADYGACLAPLMRAHAQAHALWIAPVAEAQAFRRLAADLGRALSLRRFRGGRLQAHLAPVGAVLDERDELGGPPPGEEAPLSAEVESPSAAPACP